MGGRIGDMVGGISHPVSHIHKMAMEMEIKLAMDLFVPLLVAARSWMNRNPTYAHNVGGRMNTSHLSCT